MPTPVIRRLNILLGFDLSSSLGYGLLQGIAAFATRQRDWTVHRSLSSQEFIRLQRQLRPDGLIVSVAEPGEIRRLCRQPVPCVFVGARSRVPSTHPHFFRDQCAIGELGARHLLQCRAARHAFLGWANATHSQERETSFRAALAARGQVVESFHLIRRAGSGPVPSRGLREWLTRLEKPCAIFAADDQLAHTAVVACQGAGLMVPDEVAVLGVDDEFRFCQMVHPTLSSIRLPSLQLGFDAARALHRAMTLGRERPAPHVSYPPLDVVRRGSTLIVQTDDPLIRDALHRIHESLNRPISLPELARRAGVSQRTLGQRFEHALRRSPLMEIRRQRMELAKSLLADSTRSVSWIASECGFRSLAYFDASFQEHAGMSPTRYRLTLRPDLPEHEPA